MGSLRAWAEQYHPHAVFEPNTSAVGPSARRLYTFDLTAHPTAANDTTSFGAPNNLNQLAVFGPRSLTYGTNGNLTGIGANDNLAYDVENRLTQYAVTGGVTIDYAYDPAGRRASRTIDGVTTRFLWSGEQQIAEYDGSGTLLRRFIPGPGLDQWGQGSMGSE
ncbi:RHS repeat protein [Magnetospira sp. QH-2]|uniref:RHS repeat protein n=1 Tax=Magnetospira sp. (strain QH-2) TaxID=1288970 RepID=UPI0003E80C35|nr:RHS repeat protein [Magnetospira sp. QH-2]CCQ74717.1 protein of unknown function [Magnetospira sp. QH-2]